MLRTDEGLPLAGSTGVTRDGKIGLETELSGDGGHDLTTLTVTGERGTVQEGLSQS